MCVWLFTYLKIIVIQSIVNEVKQDTLIPNNSNTIENKPIVEIKNEEQIEEAKTIVKKTPLLATTKVVEQSNQNINPSIKETSSIQNKKVVIPLKEEVTNTTVADQNITTKEATLLLEEAYSEVKANNNQYQVEKIDANALLEEVEIKSEKSLKNRLFHAVKSGYETLKSTVAERNY
ncbi:hypothetical protein [Olleya sp. YS]|uniref:hypothetical protein n=1 Tax=Olleya sp. YS TaxID=3028318 RepID=UPI00243453A5|nr:hypothetical protein [Olleya sp. YS]WGD35265.1 hypothetical protein Ollyesu_02375 [Olleya sp. YS]